MENKKFLDSLMGLLAINSVAYVDADEAHPYGKAVSQALEYVLNLGEELGMDIRFTRTELYDAMHHI